MKKTITLIKMLTLGIAMMLFTSASAQKVLLLGVASDTMGLTSEEQQAYDWAITHYGSDATYSSFATISSSGVPTGTDVIWYHMSDSAGGTNLHADITAAASTIESWVTNGGSIFATGFGPRILEAINVATPGEVRGGVGVGTADDNWGLAQHSAAVDLPIWTGLTSTTTFGNSNFGYRFIANGSTANDFWAWWNVSSFAATGGTPWGYLAFITNEDEIVTAGEWTKGSGKAAFTGTLGYSWEYKSGNGSTEQANIEDYTANVISYLTPKKHIILTGSGAYSGLTNEEKGAYDWAMTHYGPRATYISLADINTNGIPADAKVLWYHMSSTGGGTVPADVTTAASTIETWVNDGGSVFTSGFGPVMLGAINVATPVEVRGSVGSGTADDNWGIAQHSTAAGLPIWDGLTSTTTFGNSNFGYRFIANGSTANDFWAWWNAGSFAATGGTPWGYLAFIADENDIVTGGEWTKGSGKAAFTGTLGYSWENKATNGTTEQANIEGYTANILDYLATPKEILLTGSATDMSGLTAEEKRAYDWAMDYYDGKAFYQSLADIATNGIPATTKVIWYHMSSTAGGSVPADVTTAASTIESWVNDGGSVFTSGFGPVMLGAINVATPAEVRGSVGSGTADDNWGIAQHSKAAGLPIWDGITSTTTFGNSNFGYRFIANGSQANDFWAWWNVGSFAATGGTPWGYLAFIADENDIVTGGEWQKGNGRAAFTGTLGYSWEFADSNGATEQANLEMYTANALEYIGTPILEQSIQISIEGQEGLVIKEGEEDGKKIVVTLANTAFVDPLDAANNWTVEGVPSGVSYAITREDATTAHITLSGTPADYDTDTSLTIYIKGADVLNTQKDTFSSIGEVVFRSFIETETKAGKILLIGDKDNISDLDDDEQAAYNWALNKYGDDAEYRSFVDIVLDSNSISDYKVIWWHYDKFEDLPLAATSPNTTKIMNKFLDLGGSMFISSFAAQYAASLGLEPNNDGMEVVNPADPVVGNNDHWGFRAKDPNHPIFLNLTNPFTTLHTLDSREDKRAWWVINPDDDRYSDIPVEDRFHGTALASTEWDANFNILVTVAEWERGRSHVIGLGAGAYDWLIPDGVNNDSAELQIFTENILEYLKGESTVSITEIAANPNNVKVYPNPASNRVNINLDVYAPNSDISIALTDVQGNVIKEFAPTSSNYTGTVSKSFETTDLSNGVYFYSIQVGNALNTGKIVITK